MATTCKLLTVAAFDGDRLMSIQMTVRGQIRTVSLDKQLEDGSYRARVRQSGSGNSIRGVARKNVLGVWRFYPTNPENLD